MIVFSFLFLFIDTPRNAIMIPFCICTPYMYIKSMSLLNQCPVSVDNQWIGLSRREMFGST